jgi:hypothetical protein
MTLASIAASRSASSPSSKAPFRPIDQMRHRDLVMKIGGDLIGDDLVGDRDEEIGA